jgi:dTDP-4-amino-4,6-dideoxygalactose transaminase
MRIPYNRPYTTGLEMAAIADAVARGHLSGDGYYTNACEAELARWFGAPALLTPSCTAALELMAMLIDLSPGDEVILPSFTFSSTANAVALRGATPVFADIEPGTLNLDPERAEAAITSRTRAIMVMHYAGVACDMDRFIRIADNYGLLLLEDAAHCIGSRYRGQELGTFGALSALSFHETKNIVAGEAGALIINDRSLAERAEIIRQKGTNRSAFLDGKVDKYTWVELGSSFAPNEITAAFLLPQLENARSITERRVQLWRGYHARLATFEAQGRLRRPAIPEFCEHNAHIYYVILPAGVDRSVVLGSLHERSVGAIFHYVPLHSAPAGVRLGRAAAPLSVTDDIASRLVRLPIWVGMTDAMLDCVVGALGEALP